MAKVAINGLGRIGRATFKVLLETPELELVAVNDIAPLDNLIYLLKYDSVHGKYQQPIRQDGQQIVVGDQKISVYQEKDPTNLPWKTHGVDLVFECTGIFTKMDDLKKHVQAGARKVILSAPAKDEDTATIVHGVNLGDTPDIISCASCTTNCITPVVEIMNRHFGIEKANMTTVHAYTSSQGIVDSPAKKWRRGRAGAANFVPTTTGAAIATTKAIPELDGKFDGAAIRGPVPVGSIADINIVTSRETSVEEINKVFRQEAESDRYKGVLGVTDEHLVSTDIVGDPHASIVDLTMTQVVGGDLVKIMSWYDNEWGYVNQMIREAKSALQ
jgi:glyceraldehyde 3-phosphate dehydrogenase